MALRELIRECFEAAYGVSWRRRLPEPLLTKIRDAERDEDIKRQLGFVRMGPLYYLTFGELSQILAPATAKPVLDSLGGKSFHVQLESNILPVRNAVGHGRSVSDSGFVSLQAVYQQLVTALGEDNMLRLISRPDLGLRPEDAARALLQWLENCRDHIERLDFPCPPNPALEEARKQHWWDRDDAPFDCKLVGQAVDTISNYNRLPAGLGSRELRRQFVLQASLTVTIGNAMNALRKVCS